MEMEVNNFLINRSLDSFKGFHKYKKKNCLMICSKELIKIKDGQKGLCFLVGNRKNLKPTKAFFPVFRYFLKNKSNNIFCEIHLDRKSLENLANDGFIYFNEKLKKNLKLKDNSLPYIIAFHNEIPYFLCVFEKEKNVIRLI
jgi:hypothetical protein